MPDDNPPAFPTPSITNMDGHVFAPVASGMSLRDYFAGQAMTGWLSSWPRGTADMDSLEKVAVSSFAMADAMLAERMKGTDQ